MRRVLIVSPHFPPVNAPDHQRVRTCLPYFRNYGWEPVVLAVRPEAAGIATDRMLVATLPPDVEIHRVGALPAGLCRAFGVGNLGYRAWHSLRRAGNQLLGAGKFDLVYFSTTQWLVTTLGEHWHRRYGVPYVVDLQDPWRTDYYERPGAPPPPGGWKYRVARWQAARLEERAWRPAAGFSSVSAAYLTQLDARYGWFKERPSTVIPFGASASDFALVEKTPEISPAFAHTTGTRHCVSVGAVGPIMRRALERLFTGLNALRRRAPQAADRLRFDFIGTSYAPSGRAEASVTPIAAQHGVGDLVRESTERVGHFVALKTLLAADALVLPGSDDPAYNPSKIATCFLARKPTLALAPPGSAFAHTMRELRFGTLVDSTSDDTAPVETFLHALLHSSTPDQGDSRDEERFAACYSASACTQRLCEFFDRAVRP